MRNSKAMAAGVPAPFETLQPLIDYIQLLRAVVDNPTQENTDTYVVYDRDVFTPVANTSLGVRYRSEGFSSCILYDGVELHAKLAQTRDMTADEYTAVYGTLLSVPVGLKFERTESGFSMPHIVSKPATPSLEHRAYMGSDAALRNAARGVMNHLADCVASSGAFPADKIDLAYTLIDNATQYFTRDDPKKAAFARKRMRLELLNVWVQETQWRESPHTGERAEVLRNVALGWKFWGAPYGASVIAKTVGRMNLRSFY